MTGSGSGFDQRTKVPITCHACHACHCHARAITSQPSANQTVNGRTVPARQYGAQPYVTDAVMDSLVLLPYTEACATTVLRFHKSWLYTLQSRPLKHETHLLMRNLLRTSAKTHGTLQMVLCQHRAQECACLLLIAKSFR